ncbi:hypothetical protein MKY30_22540 [Oceanobacillus sp. FSL W8-0428]|uniref:Uncharacterized protein n=1 Tax=Oceanobacillus sojae TaxID=582851 RepID=A0A511ZKK9_9BACI|nr:hypothetical protein [Oceanobacillus sojae]GEN87998.1 hypothetical protein OSO01_27370 [Oceanobacillus sojae]
MKEKSLAIIIGIIVLAAFIIPFTLLKDVEKWYGSFLFWLILTLIVIACNTILTKDWGNEE